MASFPSTLPQLPEVTRLSPRIIRILGGNPGRFTLQGTNTYLLGTGASRLLIDTGEGLPSWREALRRTLAAEGATISKVLLTHHHHDHVGGVGDVRELCGPGVEVYIYSPPPAAPPSFQAAASGGTAGGEYLSAAWPPPYALHPNLLAPNELRGIADGQEFAVDGVTVRALLAPGHTPDHACFVLLPASSASLDRGGDEDDAGIFAGDNVLGHGTSVFGDLAAYVNSLRRMAAALDDLDRAVADRKDSSGSRERRMKTVYPAHGELVQDGKARIEEYIAHREEREAQVLGCLASTPPRAASGSGGGNEESAPAAAGEACWSSTALVEHIYRDVPRELHLAARGGVLQVLAKLASEGRVERVGNVDGWRLVARAAGSADSEEAGLKRSLL